MKPLWTSRWTAAVALVLSLVAVGIAFEVRIEAGRGAHAWETASTYAKVNEAKVAVTELAWGIAKCAEHEGKLPDTSAKVPANLQAVHGMMYQAKLSDWDDAAFKCAGFHMIRPQRFQYQWVRRSPGEGTVVAASDFAGVGIAGQSVSLRVVCAPQGSALSCRPDPMSTEPTDFEL